MHRKSVLAGYTYNGITEDDLAACLLLNLNLYDLTIGNTELLGILRSHVNMSLCNDYTLAELNLTTWADELARC